ncbi:hypothetical protein VTN31DRAFT_5277 [Thermomyces dupontii]|uniref:uncharacterized protein n=1 Tax=Talaromyces thermophilus TaxID=28565 RepID=UPI00374210B8
MRVQSQNHGFPRGLRSRHDVLLRFQFKLHLHFNESRPASFVSRELLLNYSSALPLLQSKPPDRANEKYLIFAQNGNALFVSGHARDSRRISDCPHGVLLQMNSRRCYNFIPIESSLQCTYKGTRHTSRTSVDATISTSPISMTLCTKCTLGV